MRKLWALNLLALALFVCAPIAHAQNFTTVTGTVTDPNGIPYSNATINGLLIPPGSWTLGGQPYAGVLVNTPLDANGSFSANVGSNAAILPASTQWVFTVSIAPGIPLPLGTGPQTFTTGGITISGATQSITAALDSLAPKLTNFAGGGPGSCPGSTVDTEVFFNDMGTCSGSTQFTYLYGATNQLNLLNATASTGAVMPGRKDD